MHPTPDLGANAPPPTAARPAPAGPSRPAAPTHDAGPAAGQPVNVFGCQRSRPNAARSGAGLPFQNYISFYHTAGGTSTEMGRDDSEDPPARRPHQSRHMNR